MSSSLGSTKHPILRPRIYDPFSRRGNDGSASIDTFDDTPGAVAMLGPDAAHRSDEELLTMDYDVQHEEEAENGGDYASTIDGEVEVEAHTNDGELQERDDIVQEVQHSFDTERQSTSDMLRPELGFVILALIAVGVLVALFAMFSAEERDVVTPNPTPSPAWSPQRSLPPSLSLNESLVTSTEEWIMISQIIGATDSFGFGVDFNFDATVVAVSAPKAHNGRGQAEVYNRKNPVAKTEEGFEDWERLGDPIVGDSEGDHASLGMELSLDGSHLVVGYPGNGNGFVRVFRFDNGEWKQQGQTLAGPSLMSQFGSSVSINENGTLIVVGAPLAGDEEQA